MLQEDKSAGVWKQRSMVVLTDYVFKTRGFTAPIHPKTAREAIDRQKHEPVRINRRGSRQWWWFNDRFYCEEDGLERSDVLALVRQLESKKRGRSNELMRSFGARASRVSGSQSPKVSATRFGVATRGGASTAARARTWSYHIIPISTGGSNTARDVELRCKSCNQRKGAAI